VTITSVYCFLTTHFIAEVRVAGIIGLVDRSGKSLEGSGSGPV
jgi:hypothetical protein